MAFFLSARRIVKFRCISFPRFYSADGANDQDATVQINKTPLEDRMIAYKEKMRFLIMEYPELQNNGILSRLAAAEAHEKYYFKKYTECQIDLKAVQGNFNKVIVPLTIRHYAFVIEERCAVTFQVPENESKIPKKFVKAFLKRTYQWKAIFNLHKEDIYVAFILTELDLHFMRKHGLVNTEVMSEDLTKKYDSFILDVSYSISKAIDYANNLVAHFEHSGEWSDSLKIYARPIDEYMTLFYNALFGHVTEEDV